MTYQFKGWKSNIDEDGKNGAQLRAIFEGSKKDIKVVSLESVEKVAAGQPVPKRYWPVLQKEEAQTALRQRDFIYG